MRRKSMFSSILAWVLVLALLMPPMPVLAEETDNDGNNETILLFEESKDGGEIFDDTGEKTEDETSTKTGEETDDEKDEETDDEKDDETDGETDDETDDELDNETDDGTDGDPITISTVASDGAEIQITGNIPEEAYVIAVPVDVEIDGASVLIAYDITIWLPGDDGEDVEWQPDETVTVTINSPELASVDVVSLYHMETEESEAELIEEDLYIDGLSVTFEADEFSIYILARAFDIILFSAPDECRLVWNPDFTIHNAADLGLSSNSGNATIGFSGGNLTYGIQGTGGWRQLLASTTGAAAHSLETDDGVTYRAIFQASVSNGGGQNGGATLRMQGNASDSAGNQDFLLTNSFTTVDYEWTQDGTGSLRFATDTSLGWINGGNGATPDFSVLTIKNLKVYEKCVDVCPHCDPEQQKWAWDSSGAGTDVATQNAGNDMIGILQKINIDPSLLAKSGGAYLTFENIVSGNRGIAVWTDIAKGTNGEDVSTIGFATDANRAAEQVFVGGANGPGTPKTMELPRSFLYDSTTGETATTIYVRVVLASSTTANHMVADGRGSAFISLGSAVLELVPSGSKVEWKVFPAEPAVKFIGTQGNSGQGHLMSLENLIFDDQNLPTQGASLDFRFHAPFFSGRRLAVWTDLSGQPGTSPGVGVEDISFGVNENILEGKIIVSDLINTGDTVFSVNLPQSLLYNASTNTFATKIYVAMTHNIGSDAASQGNRIANAADNGGGTTRSQSGLAKEFDIIDTAKLVIPEPVMFAEYISLNPGADSTSIGISWFTKAEEANGAFVEVIEAADLVGGLFWPSANPASYKLFTGVNASIDGLTEAGLYGYDTNKAFMTGLDPDQEYAYRVGDGTPDRWSRIHTFRTFDPSAQYHVIITSDQQPDKNLATRDAWKETMKAAMDMADLSGGASFMISAGDQLNYANDIEELDIYLEPAQLRSLPVATTVGNHDTVDWRAGINDGPDATFDEYGLLQMIYNWPNHNSLKGVSVNGAPLDPLRLRGGGNYYFSYGDTLYISLNSNVGMNINNVRLVHGDFMDEAIASHPTATWKVAFFHHNIYGAGSHASPRGYADSYNMQPAWGPFMDDYEIDIVFNGHDHVYSRSEFMQGTNRLPDGTRGTDREGAVAYQRPSVLDLDESNFHQANPPGAYIAHEGTLYISAHGSVRKFYALEMQPWVAYGFPQDSEPQYSIMSIDQGTLKLNVYRVYDDFLVDSFTLKKTADYDDLQSLIPGMEAITQSGKSQLTWDEFTAKRDAAKAILPSASAAAVNTAYMELYDAYYALDPETDKSFLDTLISQTETTLSTATEGKWTGQYPPGSIAVIQMVLNEAKTVFDLRLSTQTEIDEAYDDLNTAYTHFLTLASIIANPFTLVHNIPASGTYMMSLVDWMEEDPADTFTYGADSKEHYSAHFTKIRYANIGVNELAIPAVTDKYRTLIPSNNGTLRSHYTWDYGFDILRNEASYGPVNAVVDTANGEVGRKEIGTTQTYSAYITDTYQGEWIRYELNVATAGMYEVKLGAVNKRDIVQCILLRDTEQNTLSTFTIPANAGFVTDGDWTTAPLITGDNEIYLAAGTNIVELFFVNGSESFTTSSTDAIGNYFGKEGPDVDILTFERTGSGTAPDFSNDEIYRLPFPEFTTTAGATARQRGWATNGRECEDSGRVGYGLPAAVFKEAKGIVLEVAGRPAGTSMQVNLIADTTQGWTQAELSGSSTPTFASLYKANDNGIGGKITIMFEDLNFTQGGATVFEDFQKMTTDGRIILGYFSYGIEELFLMGAYLVFDDNGGAGPGPDPNEPKLHAITSIDFTYEFDVASFNSGDLVCIRHTIGSWANTFRHVEIDALTGPDYEFTYKWSFPASSNFYHLGRLGGCAEGVSDDPSLMPGTATLKKMVVSDGTDEYTFETNRVLDLSLDGECSIGNAWMGGVANGAKLYESVDGLAFFEFNNQEGGGIKFYVVAPPEEPVMKTDRSLKYAEAMGNGWNLGNSFDAVNQAIPGLGGGETAWNNPAVTKELIDYIATKFDHIRIPMTAFTRFTDKGPSTPTNEIRYELDSAWLARYKEVVQWAVDAGLYVMINLHHDSNRWFEKFRDDGSVQSNEVKRTFEDLWKQLAAEFAGMPDEVMFETINEPEPDIISGGKTQQERLDILNKAAYDIIRQTPGNENRMIVFSTIYARFGDTEIIGTREFMRILNDENILATVHFYHPTYGFSVNLGETMYGSSQRAGAENFFKTLKDQLTDFGVGVSVGEWGLLAYDEGHPDFDGHLQHGEELKFYEHMKHLKSEADGVSLTFWDNGSGIGRWDGSGPRTSDFSWQFPRMGEMVTGSGRSSYTTGLDTAFYRDEAAADLDIPLTLNGNAFSGIIGLTNGVDYTYSGSTLTLKKEFINDSFNLADNGIFETLVLTFNNGADWEYYLIKHGTPEYGFATGSRSSGITIPLTFNGTRVETVRAFINGTATRIGSQQSWAPGLQYADNGYKLDYINGSIIFGQQFFGTNVVSGTPVPVGPVELEIRVNYFDGQSGSFVLEIEAGGTVRVKGAPKSDSGDTSGTTASSSGTDSQPQASPAINYGREPDAVNAWNNVNNTLESLIATINNNGLTNGQINSLSPSVRSNASGDGFDFVLRTGTEIVVPAKILETLKNSGSTIMMNTGAGVTFSISGGNIPQSLASEIDLTIRKTGIKAPPEKLSEVLSGSVANVQIPMLSRESFGMLVGTHFNVGAENAGNYANLFRFNEISGEFEYLGSALINEKGQVMFAVSGGADYLLTVTEIVPSLRMIAAMEIGYYIVRPDDNLYRIARANSITLRQMIALNPQIRRPDFIRPGERIRLR